jgi:hypothetical protein
MTTRIHGGELVNHDVLHKFLEDLLPSDNIDVAHKLVRYVPQERQRELLAACGLLDWMEGKGDKKAAVCDWIGYGGAAYGGKTFSLLGLVLVAAYAYPGAQIGFFRRTYKELQGAGSATRDARELYSGLATFRNQDLDVHFGETGSSLYFSHCENETDKYKYQSKQFDILILDEATHFTWEIVDYLKTRNRVSGDCGIPLPFCVVASNPGNVGHGWYMQLFDLEHINKWIRKEQTTPLKVTNPNNRPTETFFIPSFISDNQVGVSRDPTYEERLRSSDPDLAEALIKGDWKVFSGMAFRNFDKATHVIKQSELPKDFDKLPKWRAVDWGYAAPFCCLFFARDPNTGRVYIYRELYQAGLTDAQQAVMINTNTPPQESISITYGDPISFSVKRSKGELFYTPADEYRENGIVIFNADNERISGKRKIDQLLAPLPDGKPGVMITDNCINLIRTLPKLARDEHRPEDIASNQEDHPYDAFRYGLTNPGMHSKKHDKNKPNIQTNPWTRVPGI